MELIDMVALAAAAAAAGMVNAVAGGGTLITFPTLLAVGTPPIVANATSTVALMVGTAGSLYGYRRQVAAVRPWLKRFIPVSLVGGLLGSILLTRTEEAVFARMVPFLILFATVVFVLQGPFRRMAGWVAATPKPAWHGPRALGAAIVFQFLVSVYGGYFGAGIGILMLATLGLLGMADIHEMNAVKTVLSTLINLVAAAYFVFAGLVHWPKVLVMTAGAIGGYYVGSHFSQRIPQKHVRQLITAIGFAISAVMFWRQFRR